jgi:hypothetical protein
MSVSVRSMRSEDARRFLEIHHESVRGIAATDYPAAVIDCWAALPITDDIVERLEERGEHVLGTGVPMAAVRMRKQFE